jgi:hypothetical protein
MRLQGAGPVSTTRTGTHRPVIGECDGGSRAAERSDTVQTPTAATRGTQIQDTIRRHMSDLARRSQVLNVDAHVVQGIRVALRS